MQARRLGSGSTRRYALVLGTGESVLEELTSFAEAERLGATALTATGAFESATLGYFDFGERRYAGIPVDEQVEVLTMAGDIVLTGDERKIHAYVVLGCRDGSTRGGHLLGAVVRPTLQIMLSESPADLVRREDPESWCGCSSCRNAFPA